MSLPYRQRRQLRRIRQALRLSDPRLTSRLLIVAKLSAGEQMPGREQLIRRRPPPLAAAARLIRALARLAGRVLRALWGLVRLTARGVVAVARWLGNGVRRAAGRLAGRGPGPTLHSNATLRNDMP
jgi:hypothetical protein